MYLKWEKSRMFSKNPANSVVCVTLGMNRCELPLMNEIIVKDFMKSLKFNYSALSNLSFLRCNIRLTAVYLL